MARPVMSWSQSVWIIPASMYFKESMIKFKIQDLVLYSRWRAWLGPESRPLLLLIVWPNSIFSEGASFSEKLRLPELVLRISFTTLAASLHTQQSAASQLIEDTIVNNP